jgi:predicted esterase
MIEIETCICQHSKNNVGKARKAVILLPGRGHSAEMMVDIFHDLLDIDNLAIYSIQPEIEWYPLPNGINDQVQAVDGLKKNIDSIREYILNLLERESLKTEDAILIGFSAGAVVALEILTSYQDKFSLIICHSGAILLPDQIKKSQSNTKVILFHRQDDYCFDWNERYIPMKTSLIEKEYNVDFYEMSHGNHLIYKDDLKIIHELISGLFS